MAYRPNSDTIKTHRAAILEIALRHAAERGYTRITRADIAAEAGVAVGVVNAAYGTMGQLKRDIMRHAVKRELLSIIADGLALREPQALAASPELRRRALDHMTQ